MYRKINVEGRSLEKMDKRSLKDVWTPNKRVKGCISSYILKAKRMTASFEIHTRDLLVGLFFPSLRTYFQVLVNHWENLFIYRYLFWTYPLAGAHILFLLGGTNGSNMTMYFVRSQGSTMFWHVKRIISFSGLNALSVFYLIWHVRR